MTLRHGATGDLPRVTPTTLHGLLTAFGFPAAPGAAALTALPDTRLHGQDARMRNNEPITQHEIELPDGDPLVSRTDTTGRITFVNHVFSEISGFTEDELVGAPHNLVRHPHMPPAAFANLWATIQAGRPWDGLVKNCAKSGDFYWVRANVTPVVEVGMGAEAGKVSDYISVRSKPTRAQVAAAERNYAAMREGRAGNLALRDGEVVRTGWRAALGDAGQSVLGRLAATMAAAVLLSLAVGWLGLSGMAASNDALRGVYENDLLAVNALRDIVDLTRDNQNQIARRWRWRARRAGRGGAGGARAAGARQPGADRHAAGRLHRDGPHWAHPSHGDGAGRRSSADWPERSPSGTAHWCATASNPHLALARRGETAQLDNRLQTRVPALFEAGVLCRPAPGGSADRGGALQLHRGGRQSAPATDHRRAASRAAGWLLSSRWGGRCLPRCGVACRVFQAHFAAIDRGDLAAGIPDTAGAGVPPHGVDVAGDPGAPGVQAGRAPSPQSRTPGRARRLRVDRMAVTIEQEAGSAVERDGQPHRRGAPWRATRTRWRPRPTG